MNNSSCTPVSTSDDIIVQYPLLFKGPKATPASSPNLRPQRASIAPNKLQIQPWSPFAPWLTTPASYFALSIFHDTSHVSAGSPQKHETTALQVRDPSSQTHPRVHAPRHCGPSWITRARDGLGPVHAGGATPSFLCPIKSVFGEKCNHCEIGARTPHSHLRGRAKETSPQPRASIKFSRLYPWTDAASSRSDCQRYDNIFRLQSVPRSYTGFGMFLVLGKRPQARPVTEEALSCL
ncbi:hypothetical protein VUR80DRAFT_7421 [Thermomyces stellatus]